MSSIASSNLTSWSLGRCPPPPVLELMARASDAEAECEPDVLAHVDACAACEADLVWLRAGLQPPTPPASVRLGKPHCVHSLSPALDDLVIGSAWIVSPVAQTVDGPPLRVVVIGATDDDHVLVVPVVSQSEVLIQGDVLVVGVGPYVGSALFEDRVAYRVSVPLRLPVGTLVFRLGDVPRPHAMALWSIVRPDLLGCGTSDTSYPGPTITVRVWGLKSEGPQDDQDAAFRFYLAAPLRDTAAGLCAGAAVRLGLLRRIIWPKAEPIASLEAPRVALHANPGGEIVALPAGPQRTIVLSHNRVRVEIGGKAHAWTVEPTPGCPVGLMLSVEGGRALAVTEQEAPPRSGHEYINVDGRVLAAGLRIASER